MAPTWEDLVDSQDVPRGWEGVDGEEKGGELTRRDGVIPGGGLNKDTQIGDLMPLMTTTRALLGACVRACVCACVRAYFPPFASSKHFPEHLESPTPTSKRFLPVIVD